MNTRDNGGPAFPFPAIMYPNGEMNHGEGGMTLRDYFAMQAPKEVPHWFVPKMRAKPLPKWVGESGTEYKSSHLAEKAEGDNYHNANAEAFEEWEEDRLISKMAQWPWFWADIQLEARKA